MLAVASDRAIECSIREVREASFIIHIYIMIIFLCVIVLFRSRDCRVATWPGQAGSMSGI